MCFSAKWEKLRGTESWRQQRGKGNGRRALKNLLHGEHCPIFSVDSRVLLGVNIHGNEEGPVQGGNQRRRRKGRGWKSSWPRENTLEVTPVAAGFHILAYLALLYSFSSRPFSRFPSHFLRAGLAIPARPFQFALQPRTGNRSHFNDGDY